MEPRAGRVRRPVEAPERHVVGDAHARDAGVAQRLLRHERHPVAPRLGAPGVVALAMHPHRARRRLALAGQHLDQLALAVARYAGDADDLAGAHDEGHAAHRRQSLVVLGGKPIELEARGARVARGATAHDANLLIADHQSRHVIGAERGNGAAADQAPAAQHRHLVGKSHHLAELVGDDEDGNAPRVRHVADHAEHLVGLVGREHRGRLVEDEEAALQIELLQDFGLLLFARGEGGDGCVERHGERHGAQGILRAGAARCASRSPSARRRAPSPGSPARSYAAPG